MKKPFENISGGERRRSGRVLLLCALAAAFAEARAGQGNMRVARAPEDITLNPDEPVPEAFLKRAVSAGYNYVLGPFSLRENYSYEWKDGEYRYYDDTLKGTLIRHLSSAFVQVHNYGAARGTRLKLIPEFASGNKWSAHFLHTRNPNIDWNTARTVDLEQKLRNEAHSLLPPWLRVLDGFASLVFLDFLPPWKPPFRPGNAAEICPSYAPDPEGFDKSFAGLLRVIAVAYERAKADPGLLPGFPEGLEFIHIGHDEPYTYQTPVEKGYKLYIGQSQLDKRWIHSHAPGGGGITWDRKVRGPLPNGRCYTPIGRALPNCDRYNGQATTRALEMLIADEITRRVDQIMAVRIEGEPVFGNTQILIWGDLWDPQKAGGYFGLDSLPARLSHTYLSKVILVPWQYENTVIQPTRVRAQVTRAPSSLRNFTVTSKVDAPGRRYDPAETFAYFRKHGMRFLYGWAYADGDPFLSDSRIKSAFGFLDAAPDYPEHLLGFVSCHYPDSNAQYDSRWNRRRKDAYAQPAIFNALEILALGNSVGRKEGSPVTKLDYLMVNRNTLFADLDRVDAFKTSVNFYDAVWFCNRLSKRHGYDTAYSYEGITYRGDLRNASYRDIVLHLDGLEFLPKSRGYRLPTALELEEAEQGNVPYPLTHLQGEWFYPPSAGAFPAESQDRMAPTRAAFRVVRNRK